MQQTGRDEMMGDAFRCPAFLPSVLLLAPGFEPRCSLLGEDFITTTVGSRGLVEQMTRSEIETYLAWVGISRVG